MIAADRFLTAARSWDDFFKKASALPASTPAGVPDKGKVFERLTQLYLKTHPEYQTKLRHVWRVKDELPSDIRKKIGLPRADEGIDLVAETRDGGLWAVQCKFRADTRKPLDRKFSGDKPAKRFGVKKIAAKKPVAGKPGARKPPAAGRKRKPSRDIR